MNKNVILPIILGLSLFVSLGLLVRIGMLKKKSETYAAQLQDRLLAANLEVGKARTMYGDVSKKASVLEEELKVEIKKWKGSMTRFVSLEAKYRTLKKTKTKAKIVYVDKPPVEIPAELKVQRGMLYEAVTDNTLVPVKVLQRKVKDHKIAIACKVEPQPGQRVPMEIAYEMNLRLRGQLVEKKLEDGNLVHFMNLFIIDENGNIREKAPLTHFEVVVDNSDIKPKFYWWAPHLDIGASLSVSRLIPVAGGSVGISLAGYGDTKNDLKWRFGRLGVDVSDRLGFSIDPALWNLGSVLPLVSNIWLSPHIVFRADGSRAYGFMIGAVL